MTAAGRQTLQTETFGVFRVLSHQAAGAASRGSEISSK